MFWKNKEKIKALEKEVEELSADNEKIRRILKHVGKEPCVEVGVKTRLLEDPIYPHDLRIYYDYSINHEYIYTLYFYYKGEEYSVVLDCFKNSEFRIFGCELTDVQGFNVSFIFKVQKIMFNHTFVPNRWYIDERYLIQFNYVTGDYKCTEINTAVVKAVKDEVCKECNKDNKEKKE